MSTTSQPFGLRPAFSPSGVVRPTAYSILTGYAANILQNQPVKIGTNGTIQAAAIGDRFIGTFQGVEFTDSDSRRRVSNKWTASTAGTDIVAYVTLDPSIVYEIQANGSIAVTDIGKQADYTAISAGSTTTETTTTTTTTPPRAPPPRRAPGISATWCPCRGPCRGRSTERKSRRRGLRSAARCHRGP